MHRIISLLVFFAIGTAQAATVTLDQQNQIETGPGSSGALAGGNRTLTQSFTAGLTGTLEQVDLALGYTPETTVGFEVNVYSGGGSPGDLGAALFSDTYAASYVPQYVSPGAFTAFDLSAAGIAVNAGDEFTIVVSRLSPTTGTDWILCSIGEDYTDGESYGTLDGEFWGSNTQDLAFQTHVSSIPIPAAFWLFGSALAGLGWMRRKQTV